MESIDPELRSLGERILLRRRELKISQTDLAERTGLSRVHLGRLERGDVPSPKLGDLKAIARELQMSLDTLISGTKTGLSNDEEAELERLLSMRELAPEFATFARSYEESTEQERRWLLKSLRILADRHGLSGS